MSLRFILGRAGSGKTARCVQEIGEQARREPYGPALVLLVPEQSTFIMEKALSDYAGGNGTMRGEVLSFRRLFYKLCPPCGQKGKPWLTDAGKGMLIARLLGKHAEEMRFFHNISHRSSFSGELVSLVNEFQLYKVTPEDLRQAAADSDSTTAAKLHDLAILYTALLEDLGEDYWDEGRAYAFMARHLQPEDNFAGVRFWLDGFADFNARQLDVLMALARKNQVNIALCMDPDLYKCTDLAPEHVFYPVWRTCRRLLSGARQLFLTVEEPCFLRDIHRFSPASPLTLVEKAWGGAVFLTEVPEQEKLNKAVSIIKAHDKREEVIFVAREIVRLCREENFRWRDCGIIVRHIEDYRDILEDVLPRLELAFFTDAAHLLRAHPAADILLAALEVLRDKWSHDAIFRFLKNGLSPLTATECDILENYCMAYGVRGSQWTSSKMWGHLLLKDKEATAEQAKIDGWRRKAAEPLQKLAMDVRNSKDGAGIASSLLELYRDLAVEEKLKTWQGEMRRDGLMTEAERQVQVYEQITALLEQMTSFLAGCAMDAAEMLRLLATGLEALSAELVPASLDEIFIADLQRSRTPQVRAVFVLGCNEGVFPARVESGGLLLAHERETLAAHGLELADTEQKRQLGEKYLSYIALTRGAEKLYLSYVQYDEEGTEASPSLLVSAMCQLFPDIKITPAADCSPAGGMLFMDDLLQEMAHAKKGREIDGVYRQACRYYHDSIRYSEFWQKLCQGLDYRPENMPLTAELRQKLYGDLKSSSVSRLECFNLCPCLYYGRYGLKLEPRRRFEVRGLDLGRIYHFLLEQTVRGITDWQNIQREEITEIVRRHLIMAIEGEFAWLFNKKSGGAYLQEKIIKLTVDTVMIIAEQVRCGHFLPVGFEVRFGGQDAALAGLKITLPDGSEVEIQGIIDRLDIAVAPDGTEYLRVIDYKTGGRELALADIYGGRSWQMPVYMQTVLANRTAKRVCALPAGMFYTSIKEVLRNGQSRQEAEASANPQLKLSGMAILDERAMRLAGDIEQEKESYILNMRRKKDGTVAALNALTPKEFAVVQKYIMDGVALTLERIKKGEIAPCPEQEGTYLACDYCDYTVLCALSRELNKDVRPNSAVNLTKEEIIGLMQGKEEEVGDE